MLVVYHILIHCPLKCDYFFLIFVGPIWEIIIGANSQIKQLNLLANTKVKSFAFHSSFDLLVFYSLLLNLQWNRESKYEWKDAEGVLVMKNDSIQPMVNEQMSIGFLQNELQL